MSALNRRDFFKAMGLAGAASAAAACNFDDNIYYTPVEHIVPYVVRPEQTTPGTPTFFATTITSGPAAFPVVANHRDGRVINVGANPLSPWGESIPLPAFFELQRHYSPDRYAKPTQGGQQTNWKDALDVLAKEVQKARKSGKKVAWFGPYASGALVEVLKDLTDTAVFFEPFGREAEVNAAKKLFNKRVVPRYNIDKARYVLSFGADFLGTWGNNRERVEWGQSHDPNQGHFVSRFALVSPARGQTGAGADDWYACAPGSEAQVALAIAKLVADEKGAKGGIKRLVKDGDVAKAAAASGLAEADIQKMAKQFAAKKAVALPGGVAGASATADELAAAVFLLNVASGHHLMDLGGYSGPVHDYKRVQKLIKELDGGDIGVLLLGDLNPVYALPDDSGFASAMGKAFSVSFSSHPDETNASASLVLPVSSPFEDWGDEDLTAGIHLLRQPAMSPLNDSRSLGDVLLATARAAARPKDEPFKGNFYAFIKNRWKKTLYPFQEFWDDNGEGERVGKKKLAEFMESWMDSMNWEERDGKNAKGKGAKGKNADDGKDAKGKGAKGKADGKDAKGGKGGKGKGAKGKGAKGKGGKGKGGKAGLSPEDLEAREAEKLQRKPRRRDAPSASSPGGRSACTMATSAPPPTCTTSLPR